MKKERWIPKDYKKIRQNQKLNIAVYSDGKLSAIGYSGNRSKHDFYFQFRSKKSMKEYLDDYMARMIRHAKEDAIEKAKRAAELKKPCGLNPDDILVSSWGYEQTNVNFYQVISVKNRTVKMREIALKTDGESWAGAMSDHVVPVKDAFLERAEVMTKRVGIGDSVKLDYGYAGKWDGRPRYRSWYA